MIRAQLDYYTHCFNYLRIKLLQYRLSLKQKAAVERRPLIMFHSLISQAATQICSSESQTCSNEFWFDEKQQHWVIHADMIQVSRRHIPNIATYDTHT